MRFILMLLGIQKRKSRNDFCFRNGFLGEVEGAAAAEFAVKNLKAKKISIISMDNDFGRAISAGFAERSEKLGATILTKQMYKFPGEKDFRPFLTRVAERSGVSGGTSVTAAERVSACAP